MVQRLDEDLSPSRRIVLVYEAGTISLGSQSENKNLGCVDLSPALRSAILCEILIDANQALLQQFDSTSIAPRLNQGLKFLDNEKADSLGNSKSIRVGPRNGVIWNPEGIQEALELYMGFIIALQSALETRGETPPIPLISREEYQEMRRNYQITIKNLEDRVIRLKLEVKNRDRALARLHHNNKTIQYQQKVRSSEESPRVSNGPKYSRSVRMNHQENHHESDLVEILRTLERLQRGAANRRRS